MSKIEWTDETWNPIAGCSIASPGCTNCCNVALAPEATLTKPLTWRPRRLPRLTLLDHRGVIHL